MSAGGRGVPDAAAVLRLAARRERQQRREEADPDAACACSCHGALLTNHADADSVCRPPSRCRMIERLYAPRSRWRPRRKSAAPAAFGPRASPASPPERASLGDRDGLRPGIDDSGHLLAVPLHDHHDGDGRSARALALTAPRAIEWKSFLRASHGGRGQQHDRKHISASPLT